MRRSSTEMLEIVAKGLDDLLDRVTFVGGTTTFFYIDDRAAPRVRPTDDVDCVIDIVTRKDYYEFEKEIREHGFRNSMEPGDPICRWVYEGVKIDIMPIDPDILGFSNKWYKDGIDNSEKKTLPSGKEISVFTLPHFVATKIEAHKSRGDADLRFSTDLEDIITVMDGRSELSILHDSPENVKSYLKAEFSSLLKNEQFDESVQAFIGTGPTSTARAIRIIDFLKEFTS